MNITTNQYNPSLLFRKSKLYASKKKTRSTKGHEKTNIDRKKTGVEAMLKMKLQFATALCDAINTISLKRRIS